MKHIQKLRKLLLTLAVLMLAVQASFAASASYVDDSGTSQTVGATELASTTTSWTDGSWYIVPEGGVTISSRITVNGTVNLILRDGATLTASAGITTTNATLNIYAQSAGTCALTATGSTGCAGIGGCVGSYGSTGGAGGTVSIFGGTVTATGGTADNNNGGGAGIGGGGGGMSGKGGAGGAVSISGGTVTATGGTASNYAGGGAGIGGGGKGHRGSDGASGILTLGKGVKLYNGTDNTGTVLDDSDSESRSYSGSRVKTMFAEYPKGSDKIALNDAITAAETLYNSIEGGDDYSTIAGTLNAAIYAAKEVAYSDTADQDEVDAATTAITTAKTNAEAAKKDVDDTTEANKVSDLIEDLPAKEEITKNDSTKVDAAKAAYDYLTEDQKKKVSEEDKQKLNDAVAAIEAIKKDEADTAAANAVIAKINALPATDAITSANKDAIEVARAAYDALTDDQKAKISDTVKNKLESAETAVVAAEFNEYKEAQKTAAENKAQDGDSEATIALITAAKATIDALTYDATKTLDENKAAVTAVVTQLATALAAQRAAEQPVTVAAKADPLTTGTYYATFYDSTTSYTADCEVYYATANADGRLTLQKAEGNVIKAGEGVILKATSETVTLTQTDAAASYDSLLTGSDTETTVENALVLSLGKNGVWFYKYSGTLGANKAYLAQ